MNTKKSLARALLLGLCTFFAIGAEAKKPEPPMYVTVGSGEIRLYTAPNTYTVYASGLNNPGGLAIDRKENVLYVTEVGANRVLKFTGPNTTPTVFATLAGAPTDVALDGCGNVFVISPELGELRMYKDNGTPAPYTVWGSGLGYATSLALDADQRVAVSADSPDGQSGTIKLFSAPNAFTTYASGLPYLRALSYDSEGTLYAISNTYPGDVKAFTAPNTYSVYASGITFPYGAYASPSDIVYVFDVSSIRAYTAPNVYTTFASGLFYPNHASWPTEFKKNNDCKSR